MTLPSTFPGEAKVRARVGAVFRGKDSLPKGSTIEFEVSVLRSMDEMPTGPVCWMLAECLREGRWLEAFLNGHPPHCSVAMWQSEPIDGPTPEPRISLAEF